MNWSSALKRRQLSPEEAESCREKFLTAPSEMRLAPPTSRLQGHNVREAYEWETTPTVSSVIWLRRLGIPGINRERLQQGSANALCLIGTLHQISNTALEPGKNPLGQSSCQVLLSSAKPTFERSVGLCTDTDYC